MIIVGFAVRFTETTTINCNYSCSHKIPIKRVLTQINVSAGFQSTQLFFQKNTLSLVWYIANQLDYFQRNHWLKYSQITISTFKCERRLTNLSVYPGLLSMFMMNYKVAPVTKLQCYNCMDEMTVSKSRQLCNQNNTVKTPLVKHVYVTLKLDVPVGTPVHINIDFDIDHINLNTQKFIDTGMKKFPDSSTGYSPSQLEVTHYRKSMSYLELTSFVYGGAKNTVRRGLVFTHRFMPRKYKSFRDIEAVGVDRGKLWCSGCFCPHMSLYHSYSLSLYHYNK